MFLNLIQNVSIVIKLKNKTIIFTALLILFFFNNVKAQSNYYDFDFDNLRDEIKLNRDFLTINFGNKKNENFELPEIIPLNNLRLVYKNPNEISIYYSGDRGLYGVINLYYKKKWFIKDINYYSPCQECEDQNYKILSKTINLPLYKINSELLDINAKNFKSLKFYDYESILKSYTNIKKIYNDLAQFYLLSSSFNESVIPDFRKKFPLSKNNLNDYNNIAYILSINGNQKTAIELLREILHKFPNRTVAYLNLADSYWAIGNQELAKENYKKYIELMKFQKKNLTKIPEQVWERIK